MEQMQQKKAQKSNLNNLFSGKQPGEDAAEEGQDAAADDEAYLSKLNR